MGGIGGYGPKDAVQTDKHCGTYHHHFSLAGLVEVEKHMYSV